VQWQRGAEVQGRRGIGVQGHKGEEDQIGSPPGRGKGWV